MEFTANKKNLFKALQRVNSIANSKHPISILSHVLIETIQDKILLSATNLELGITCSCDADIITTGKLTVQAKKLSELVKEFPDEKIMFTLDEAKNRLNIKCFKSKYSLPILSSLDFPAIPTISEENYIAIKTEHIKKMIAKTSFAICNNESRAILTGALLKFESVYSKFFMVATDGHRLAYTENTCEVNKDIEVLIPKKAILELKKIVNDEVAENVLIGLKDNQAFFKVNDVKLFSSVINGQFPDFRKFIPDNNQYKITLNRDTIHNIIKRISIFANEESKGINFEFSNNKLIVSAIGSELGEGVEETDIEFVGNDVTFKFNYAYLLDMLDVIDNKDVSLEVNEISSPVLFKCVGLDNCKWVIMPMRK